MFAILLYAAVQAPPDILVRYDFSRPVSFEVKQTFRSVEGEEETVYQETLTVAQLEELAGGAAKVKIERTLTGMSVDGLKLAVDPSTTTTIESRSPRGEVRDRLPTQQLDQLLELRLMRIGEPLYPPTKIELGVVWQVTAKPTEDGLPGATWQWTFQKLEGSDLSGKFSFEESDIDLPIRAEGEFTVSIKDGWPKELRFKAINTHLLGDEDRVPTVYAFELKRK